MFSELPWTHGHSVLFELKFSHLCVADAVKHLGNQTDIKVVFLSLEFLREKPNSLDFGLCDLETLLFHKIL